MTTVRDAGGANHPTSPDRLGLSCCAPRPRGRPPAPGLGAAISPGPHGVSAGRSGTRHPGPIWQRGGRVGREAGAERSAAAGRALPPGRLALGKAAQMRIRAVAFPRAAHMCQVKRGFGSWQHRPEQGTRTSGRILGSLPLRPVPALRGSGQPNATHTREGGKVLPVMPRVTGFSKGDAAAFERFLGQKAGRWGHLQMQGHSCRCPLQKQGDPGTSRQEVKEPKPPSMSTEDMPGRTQPSTAGSGYFSATSC